MSETISANTLFHFTRSKDNLYSILKNGINVRYCLEKYGFMINDLDELVLPMTCFCDIPLSRIDSHTKKYGSYAIGLTKNWGMSLGISPVIYTHKDSSTAKILNDIKKDSLSIFTDALSKKIDKDKEKENSTIIELESNLGHFIKYIKPYNGTGYSNGKEISNVVFYDEREWRYVPDKDDLDKMNVKESYLKEVYFDKKKLRAINIKMAGIKVLKFQPKDIRFIVVHKDSEIPNLLRHLDTVFGDNATTNDLLLLKTRIISLQQVNENL